MNNNTNQSNHQNLQISDSEKVILDVLWKQAPLTAKEIIGQLDNTHDWQDKTVKTLINRLLKKDAISFEKQGREYRYFPLIEEDSYIEAQTDNFVKRMFKGSVSSLVAAFAKKEKLTAEEIDELKKLLKEIEK